MLQHFIQLNRLGLLDFIRQTKARLLAVSQSVLFSYGLLQALHTHTLLPILPHPQFSMPQNFLLTLNHIPFIFFIPAPLSLEFHLATAFVHSFCKLFICQTHVLENLPFPGSFCKILIPFSVTYIYLCFLFLQYITQKELLIYT